MKNVLGRSLWAMGGEDRVDEGETVIGEESSRKGKRGGGEALEAPGSTWCTRYRYITLATPRRPHSFSLSPSSRLSACLPHTCPLFTLFLFRSSARKVAERERGKRKGRHRMIAVLN